MKSSTLIFVVALLSGCFGATPEKTGLEGKSLPDFTLLLTDSTTIHTKNIQAGKALAFFFFSPHCPHCRAEVKEITEDLPRLKDINFYFISSFPLEELIAFQDEFRLKNYSNIIIGKDSANLGADYFEVMGVPYMVIYGKDKVLNKAFMGKLYSGQIKKVAEE